MSVANLEEITQRLINNGRAADTPAAVIQNGTKAEQRILVTTLENAADDVKSNKITSPAIFIVGEVVKLRDSLKWFDTRPLFGKKILITRARSQASKLSKMLSNFGANCIEIPAIKIIKPSDNYSAVDEALAKIREYHFIIFTSENGVKHFFERLKLKKLDTRSLANAKVAAIGSTTAAELLAHGIIADFIPAEFKAEALIELLKGEISGKKVLIPRAEEAREILPQELKGYGAAVEIVPIYKTISAIEGKINFDDIDLVTFTSSSTVKNLVSVVGVEVLKNVKIAAIGPITAATLKDFGIEVDIEAKEYTIAGLVDAILKYYQGFCSLRK